MGSYGYSGKQPSPAKLVEDHFGYEEMKNVLAYSKKGRHLWIVAKHITADKHEFVYATLLLVSQFRDEYVVKPIDEFMGPVEIDIPRKLFKMLTPIETIKRLAEDHKVLSASSVEWSESWRNRVTLKLATPKSARIAIVENLMFTLNNKRYKVYNPTYSKMSFTVHDENGKLWCISRSDFYKYGKVENPMQDVQQNLF